MAVPIPFPSDLPTRLDVINHVFHSWHEHRWAYDFETLTHRLRAAGFTVIERADFGRSRVPALAQDRDQHKPYRCTSKRSRADGRDSRGTVAEHRVWTVEPTGLDQLRRVLMNMLMLRPPDARNGNRVLGLVRRLADLHEHKWMYDQEGLLAVFEEAGFARPAARQYLESVIPRAPLEQVEREIGSATAPESASRRSRSPCAAS